MIYTSQRSSWHRLARVCAYCEQPITGRLELLTATKENGGYVHFYCQSSPQIVRVSGWVYRIVRADDPERARYLEV